MPKRIARRPPEEELLQSARQLDALARLAPVARLFGVRGKALADHLARGREVAAESRRLVADRRRFSEVFGPRGWVAFERMDMAVTRAALAAADADGAEAGESVLVDHYTADVVRQHLRSMSAIEAFRPRADLLDLAAEDYERGRYHACVPVVLAQVEGLHLDVLRERFFERRRKAGKELVAWGSMSATPGGLPDVAALLSTPRNRTEPSPIDLPYRHGILHGRDLGYGNRMVAAKAWATLFASRDLLTKAERGQLGPPPPKEEPTVRETLVQIAANARVRRALESWSARESFSLLPGDPGDEGTPERTARQWLEAWVKRDFSAMATLSHPQMFTDVGGVATASDMQAAVPLFVPVHVAHVHVTDKAAAVTEVDATVTDRAARSIPVGMRMLYLNEGAPTVRGLTPGRWGVGVVRFGGVTSDTVADSVWLLNPAPPREDHPESSR